MTTYISTHAPWPDGTLHGPQRLSIPGPPAFLSVNLI